MGAEGQKKIGEDMVLWDVIVVWHGSRDRG